jgi:hypothetical protein
MSIKYEVITNFHGEIIKRIDSEGNEAWIPIDSANSDYQEYLASIEPTEPEEE